MPGGRASARMPRPRRPGTCQMPLSQPNRRPLSIPNPARGVQPMLGRNSLAARAHRPLKFRPGVADKHHWPREVQGLHCGRHQDGSRSLPGSVRSRRLHRSAIRSSHRKERGMQHFTPCITESRSAEANIQFRHQPSHRRGVADAIPTQSGAGTDILHRDKGMNLAHNAAPGRNARDTHPQVPEITGQGD
jgi:hypothetical protein